jgi:cytochrome c-type biogenesis protein CcmH/NrfF
MADMNLRFSIRGLLWLTAIVALVLGFWLSVLRDPRLYTEHERAVLQDASK